MGEASRYDRVVLKLSGEVFADTTTSSGIDAAVVQRIADEVAAANTELGVEIAVVVGGGNIFRGMPGAERGTGHEPTTWGCWRPSSTRSRCRTRSKT